MSLSLKDLEQMDDEEKDEVVTKDIRFFVRRVSLCVISLALMFAFGFFAMKLRGGKRRDDGPQPPPDATDRFPCSALGGYVNYTRQGVAIRHSILAGNASAVEIVVRPSAASAAAAPPTRLVFETGEEDTGGGDGGVDHSRCSDGEFRSWVDGAHAIACKSPDAAGGFTMWGERLVGTGDVVSCVLSAKTAEQAVTVRVHAATVACGGGGGGGDDGDGAPSLSSEAGAESALRRRCVGRNVTLLSGAPFAEEEGLVGAAGGGGDDGTNATVLRLSLLPFGTYNASVEFLLLL